MSGASRAPCFDKARHQKILWNYYHGLYGAASDDIKLLLDAVYWQRKKQLSTLRRFIKVRIMLEGMPKSQLKVKPK